MTETLDTWPAGATWLYSSNIANDAAGASDITWTVTVPVGSEAEILYGLIFNGDTVARNCTVQIRDDTPAGFVDLITRAVSVAAGAVRSFPVANASADNGGVAAGTRLLVSGGMDVQATVAAVALSQDGTFNLAMRIKGSVPTVATTGGGVEVVTITIQKVL